jgi:hypothetical protein
MEIKNRIAGLFYSSAIQAGKVIMDGGEVAIISKKEDNTAERAAKIIKDFYKVDVTIEPIYTKKPINNMRTLFDERAEPTGVDILPQVSTFSGWKLNRKK